MQTTTIPFVVYRQTGDARWIGIAGSAILGTQVLTVLPGGHLADSANRPALIKVANLVMLGLGTALALLVGHGHAQAWQIVLLASLMAMVFGIQQPSWQTLPSELVPPAALHNASDLTITIFQAARALGPLIAGGLLAGPGAVWTFWCNAASFVPVLIALAVISHRGQAHPSSVARPDGATHAGGFRQAWRVPGVAVAVLLTAATAGLGMPILPLATLVAARLHAGAGDYGVLVSAFGWGSLVTSLTAGVFGHRWSRGTPTLIAIGWFGAAVVLLGASTDYGVAVLAMGLAGVGFALGLTNFHAAVQSLPAKGLRGRSVSLYLLAIRVGAGGGALVQAWVASATSVGLVLRVAGAAMVALALLLTVQRGWIASMAG